jgi:uncharacterized membrane protein YvbJ
MIPENAREIKFCGICQHRQKARDEYPCHECTIKSLVEFREKNKEAWDLHIQTKEHHVSFKEIADWHPDEPGV